MAEAVFRQGSNNDFNKKKAKVFAVELGGSVRTLVVSGDVYEALENATDLLETDVAIGVETCGWASPRTGNDDDDDDLPPSQHPARRRVRLISIVSRKFEMASALGFQDTPDEVITDEGQARGSLAEGLQDAMRRLINA
jgi:hypothetical protein